MKRLIGFIEGVLFAFVGFMLIGCNKALKDSVKHDEYRDWLRKDLGINE